MEEGVRREHWDEYLNFWFYGLSLVKYMHFHGAPKMGSFIVSRSAFMFWLCPKWSIPMSESMYFGNETGTGKYLKLYSWILAYSSPVFAFWVNE